MFFFVFLLSVQVFATECPKQTVEGLYTGSERKVRQLTIAGETIFSSSDCKPVIQIHSTDQWQQCEGWRIRILGQELFNNVACSNKIVFDDPNGFLKSIPHGSEVTMDVSCLEIISIK